MNRLALLLALFAAPLAAQDQPPLFQATTELVVFDVQVLHAKTGVPAPSLRAADLRVFEEGVQQQIVHFSRDQYPISAVLLFDLTLSVRPVLRRLAAGAKTALSHFKPDDEISVMAYAERTRLLDGFTTDRTRTLKAIEEATGMKSMDAAYFNEAMYQAAVQLRQARSPSNRRVVIWLTDNLPNVPYEKRAFPVHTEWEAFRALHEGGVVVAPILQKSRLWAVLGPLLTFDEAPKAKRYPPGDAHIYAEKTGGQTVGLRGKQPDERLAQLIDELHARYTVGYRPPDSQPDGTFRHIRVELAPEGFLRPSEWNVLARDGYYR
jgi:VWFA-related protein